MAMERPHTSKSGSNNAVDDYATERTKSNEKAANLKTLDEIPDGGWRAWTVVFGSWCCTFLISGWINALGVFQEYYSTELFPQLPTTTVALIPALVEFLVFAGGPIFGLIYDKYGSRFLLAAGAVLHVSGLVAASFAGKHFYAIILSQGVLSPIGASMMLYPAISTVSTWFSKRRGLALGLTSTGGSIGGMIFPLIFDSVEPVLGFGWAMRACALLVLVLAIVGNLTVYARTPPQPRKFHWKDWVRPFKSNDYMLLCLSLFMYLGLFLPLNYIIVQAEKEGMSDSLADKMLIIINAASLIGRTVPAWAADYVGRYNISIMFSFMSSFVVWSFWIPLQRNNTGVITFAVFYGIFSGAVIALTPALVAQISDVKDIGVRTGTLYGLLGILVLASTLSAGGLVDAMDGEFIGLKVFCGATIAVGVFFLLWARVALAGWSPRKAV